MRNRGSFSLAAILVIALLLAGCTTTPGTRATTPTADPSVPETSGLPRVRRAAPRC
ncbi:MAG: hypothetical protein LUP97_00015 [Methanoregula sp.]|nr:hypothetical protein [Methanoregula sp.]